MRYALKLQSRKMSGPVLLALAVCSAPALAGRPLVVEDAGTNAKGHGHVEAWVAKAPGSTVWNIAPAYAPLDGLEFAVGFSRERESKSRATAIQGKWVITPSRDNGCNFGVIGGTARISGGNRSNYVNGITTCNGLAGGSVHANLGLQKASGASGATTWGVAYERSFGAVTPHIEWFGAEGSKPTLQIGARAEVFEGVQIDGSVGRSGGETVWTLGTKLGF